MFLKETDLGGGYRLVRMKEAHVGRVTDIMRGAEPWKSYGMTRDSIAGFLGGSVRAGVARIVVIGKPARPVHPGRVLGVVTIQPAFLGGRFLEILALDEAHRGKGIGRRVIDAVCLEAPLRVRDLFVLVAETNTTAKSFYEHLGFKDVGTMPGLILPEKVERLIWLRFR